MGAPVPLGFLPRKTGPSGRDRHPSCELFGASSWSRGSHKSKLIGAIHSVGGEIPWPEILPLFGGVLSLLFWFWVAHTPTSTHWWWRVVTCSFFSLAVCAGFPF